MLSTEWRPDAASLCKCFTYTAPSYPHGDPVGRSCHCSHFIDEETEVQTGSNLVKVIQLVS